MLMKYKSETQILNHEQQECAHQKWSQTILFMEPLCCYRKFCGTLKTKNINFEPHFT